MASKIKNQDVIAFETVPGNSCFEVFRFSDGKLYDREEFLFDALPDNGQTRSDFIVQYYSMQREIPKQITADFLPGDRECFGKRWGEKGKKGGVPPSPKGRAVDCVGNFQKERGRTSCYAFRENQGGKKAVLDELQSCAVLKKRPNISGPTIFPTPPATKTWRE